MAEFTARARASGAQVLAGGCVPVGDAGLPFAAVTEALRGVAHALGRSGFEALAGPGRAELVRLVPDLAPVSAPAAADPATGGWPQARLFELLLGFLGRLAARSPVVLVIEDLHWADEATRDLVAYLVHSLGDERLLLLATVRSDDLHRRHPLLPLLAELGRSPRVERMDLAPFERDELAAQLAAHPGPGARAGATWPRSRSDPKATPISPRSSPRSGQACGSRARSRTSCSRGSSA